MQPKIDRSLSLRLHAERFAIARLEADREVPEWALEGPLTCQLRSRNELSLLCLDECVPAEVRAERDFRLFEVSGPLDFALVGILASLTAPLAEASISVFCVSSFDTDFVLVRSPEVARARDIFVAQGFELSGTI